jgi:hypothetical protein
MAKLLKKEIKPVIDKSTHKGYNEKNPTQPQGAFKADSMETRPKGGKNPTEKNQ